MHKLSFHRRAGNASDRTVPASAVLLITLTAICAGAAACRSPLTNTKAKATVLKVPAYTRTKLVFPEGRRPIAAAVGDIDGDGDTDIVAAGTPVAASGGESGIVREYLLNPRRGYRVVDMAASEDVRDLAVADIDGDGTLDIVTANGAAKSISVFRGVGERRRAARVDRDTEDEVIAVALADLNGDGRPDITTVGKNGSIGVSLNAGNAGFGPWEIRSGEQTAAGLLIADADDDGIPDLLIPDADDGTIRLLLGRTEGGFNDGVPADIGGRHASGIAVGDFNEDGVTDLAVTVFERGSVHVLVGTGQGRFRLWKRLGVGPAPRHLATADFNQDGRSDLLVTTSNPDHLILLYGTDGGGFASIRPLTTGDAPVAGLAADLNGDGFPDLVVVNSEDSSLTLLASTAKQKWNAILTPDGPFGGTRSVSGPAPLYEDAVAAFKRGSYFESLRLLRRVHTALSPEFAAGRLGCGQHEEERQIYVASVLLMSDLYRYYTGEPRTARDLESSLATTAAKLGRTALAAAQYLSLADIESMDLDNEAASIQALIRLDGLARSRPQATGLLPLLTDMGKLRIDRLHQGYQGYHLRLPTLPLPYPLKLSSADLRRTLLPHLEAYSERSSGAARYAAFAKNHPRSFRAVVAEYLRVHTQLPATNADAARLLGGEFSRRHPQSLLAGVLQGEILAHLRTLGDRAAQRETIKSIREVAAGLGLRAEIRPTR